VIEPKLQALERLFDLARSDLTDAEPRRGAASLLAVERRLQQRSERRGRQVLLRNVGAVLLSAALITWLAVKQVGAPIEMEVVAGEPSLGGQLSPSTTSTTVRFSDGSQLEVERAARAEVASLHRHGADIRLRHGQLRLQVAKRPGADWNVLAGAYRVHVTGTSFAVALSDGGERLDLEMFSGSVRVSGPLIEREIEVANAQRLRIDGVRGRVSVEPGGAPATRDPPTEPSAEPQPDDSPPEVDVPLVEARPAMASERKAVRKSRSRSVDPSWQSRVAAGQFSEVLEAARARGLEGVYERASLDDLEALADAARYAQQPGIAREALLAMRRRFVGSKPAKQAAFLLGRIVEHESGAGALDWYERYLTEDPAGVHASQALGRRMLIVYRHGEIAAASEMAREYLERFPKGSHAPNAKKIIAGP
jgi:transmembrane sensor